MMQSNLDKSSKKEIQSDPESEVKKKSTFIPPNLDANISIDSVKINNHILPDNNKIENKDNERVLMDKMPNINIQVK
jgi:hypothetical protein